MNKINVSELTDTELNRAMIWLYPPSKGDHIHVGGKHWINCIGEINYLTDYNLTMPLAFENGLSVDMSKMRHTHVHSTYKYGVSKNPLRAICEVLVMIKLEEMGL